MTRVTAALPPTEKQLSYLDALVGDMAALRKAVEGDAFDADLYVSLGKTRSREFTRVEISDVIGGMKDRLQEYRVENEAALQAVTTATTSARPKAAEPGYYVRDGEVFVVVENKAKTSTYAKRMTTYTDEGGANRGKWVYAPGVGRDFAAAELVPLTVEEAAKLGRLYGICVICGATLTDPESVERGIGPVCAGKVK